MDDRGKTRVIFHVSASLDFDGQTINGNVENLSIGGMYINTSDKLPPNSRGDITIYLSGASSELTLNMAGEVVRKEPGGAAVKFSRMDLDSYIHLKNIIAFNKMDEYKLMKEFEETNQDSEVY